MKVSPRPWHFDVMNAEGHEVPRGSVTSRQHSQLNTPNVNGVLRCGDICLHTELWAFQTSLIKFVTLNSSYFFCCRRGKERVREIASPNYNERKRMGCQVLIFFFVARQRNLGLLFYFFFKRKLNFGVQGPQRKLWLATSSKYPAKHPRNGWVRAAMEA